MKLSCSRVELRDALRVVSGVVDPRNIKPILKDIHIRTVNGLLELSATDLEVGIKYVVRDVDTEEEGGIVVPADPVSGIVSESQDERLFLTVNENMLIITGATSRFQVMGVSEEEFPEIPDFPEEKSLEIEGAVFSEMIDKTSFAVAVEKQRYALNGVLLAAKEKSPRIELVGTDGRRLALIRRKANSPSPFDSSAIIPVKALLQLRKMLSEEDVARIIVHERQVLMKNEQAVLVAQLVEGRFPPYDEVVPDDCDKKMEVQGSEFVQAIRQAAVLSSKATRAVRLSVEKGKILLDSSDVEAGEAHVELGAKYDGDPVQIRFNPDYLLDGLKAIGDTVVRMEMKDSSRAAVMRSGTDYLYLLMPITQE